MVLKSIRLNLVDNLGKMDQKYHLFKLMNPSERQFFKFFYKLSLAVYHTVLSLLILS